MATKKSKGNYYRKRTQEWLEDLGYWVSPCEISRRIVTPKGVVNQTRDIWGADLIARDEEKVIFVQVKSNPGDVAKGMKELSRGPWPEDGSIARWVVVWPRGRRKTSGPDITEVSAK